MRTRSYRRFLLTMGSLVLATSVVWAQEGQAQGREFHWSGKLAADNIVEIKGINGNIDAESSDGNEVEVTAEKSGPRADEVKIEVLPHADGVTICAIYPSGLGRGHCEPGRRWDSGNQHGDDTKVHFTVRVPGNIRFSGQNVNGEVNAKNMGRFVHASTVNGNIRVSTKSWAEVASVNGDVKANMGSSDWRGTLSAETVNGAIELELPGDLNAEVSFKSVNGRLHTEFPLSVDGSLGGHWINGRIGNGGRELKLETVNGNVELKKAEI